MKVISILGFALMVAALVGLIAIRSLFWASPVVVGFQALAVALMI